MSAYAPPVQRLITELSKLPGVGGRTAQRLAFYVLRQSDEEAMALADAIREVKQRVGKVIPATDLSSSDDGGCQGRSSLVSVSDRGETSPSQLPFSLQQRRQVPPRVGVEQGHHLALAVQVTDLMCDANCKRPTPADLLCAHPHRIHVADHQAGVFKCRSLAAARDGGEGLDERCLCLILLVFADGQLGHSSLDGGGGSDRTAKRVEQAAEAQQIGLIAETLRLRAVTEHSLGLIPVAGEKEDARLVDKGDSQDLAVPDPPSMACRRASGCGA